MDSDESSYVTGTGQTIIGVHTVCSYDRCPIHKPSDHAMRGFPTHWRDDRKIMERICPHGVGHPDPDQLYYFEQRYGAERARAESVHGCCHKGCCYK